MATPGSDEDTCDEYPYASVIEGGSGAIIRCTDSDENTGEDSNATEDGEWGLHKADPADYFPPHLRREFLLADGSRTVLPTRNLTASYDDAIFYSMSNGTVVQTYAVRELFGMEKSPELQDPALKNTKRAFHFLS
ncbi:hypothetical protein N0V94_007764 [Neodidymelliopsis sp. IMI 364377]|nr:hypothetical protein N0V94_007764 [Neodidymelliopsis sp. IMI 364377]